MPEEAQTPLSPSEIVSFLENPDSYPHRPSAVRIIQTHASWVAIVPPFVYKVKKPVDFGFLDFSTLEKRKHFCEEEVRLNRRLSEEIYQGVVPITRSGEGFEMDGEGETVEYAVVMRKLNDAYFMRRLLEEDGVSEEDLERIVEKLYTFYQSQESTDEVAEWGRIGRLRITTDENFEQTTAFVGDLMSGPAFKAVRTYTDEFYRRHTGLFNERRADGHVLDCHGDLHLEHIHLAPKQLTIYDCIEFNERLRFIDVANDVAFLCMDLDIHGRPFLSSFFADRMAHRLADPDLLTLLDFYKCYRAYVRAKVNSFRSVADGIPDEERTRSKETATRYYQLALRYAVTGSEPAAIIVMGRVGTGKSLHANALADDLGWSVYSSDRIRKSRAGQPLHERSDEEMRRILYTPERTDETYRVLENAALRHGRERSGCVLDATYGDRKYRERLRERLDSEGIRHCFVELISPLEEVKSRLEARDGSGDVVSDARAEDLSMLLSRYDPPGALEDAYHFTVSTESERDKVSARILDGLSLRLRSA